MGSYPTWLKIFLGLAILIFILLGWPTLWQFGQHEGKLVRINRITGTIHILSQEGWVNIHFPVSSLMTPEPQKKVEVQVLQPKEPPKGGEPSASVPGAPEPSRPPSGSQVNPLPPPNTP